MAGAGHQVIVTRSAITSGLRQATTGWTSRSLPIGELLGQKVPALKAVDSLFEIDHF